MSTAKTATKPSEGARKGPTTLARAYFEALGEQDLDAATALWRPGSIDRAVGLFELRAPEGIREWFGGLFAAFPDFSLEVMSIVAQRDTAAVRWRGRGTFNGTGKFEGLTPNGASIDIEGCDLIRVEDGEIVENNAYLNGTDMARQIGALPPQGSIAERGMTGILNAKVAAAELVERARSR